MRAAYVPDTRNQQRPQQQQQRPRPGLIPTARAHRGLWGAASQPSPVQEGIHVCCSLARSLTGLLIVLVRFLFFSPHPLSSLLADYGNYVKDLSHLGRRMEDILIVDNSPFSYMFQNDNAIPITSWFNDKNDRQLWELIPYLDVAAGIDNVQMLVRSRKPAYGSGVGVPPNLLPPGWQPSIQDADVMNAQQRRGQ